MPARQYEVVIVGAGPAGLSAAVVLGRCRRRVLLCDAGHQRNIRSLAMHCYLTRDGIAPAEFLSLAHLDLVHYPAVEVLRQAVTSGRRIPSGFEVTLENGDVVQARRLLLATGVVDDIPDIKGIDALYGTSVHHCPYCDGWEWRDQPIAVYGKGSHVAGLAMTLRTWSSALVVCADGPGEFSPAERAMLERHGIQVREERVHELVGRDGLIEQVVFERGEPFSCRAFFFNTGQRQHSSLAAEFGCEFNERGTVVTGRFETTNVPGLFVARDASKAVQFVIMAAAEGADAACEINRSLEEEDRIPP
ncbi:MAG: NAD(P)/FAD-dependent oxidoreductase [Gemmatimonadota bacterium]